MIIDNITKENLVKQFFFYIVQFVHIEYILNKIVIEEFMFFKHRKM